MRARPAIPALLITIALGAAGCSNSDDHGMGSGDGHDMMDTSTGSTGSTGSSGSGAVSVPEDAAFNATDVAFAQGMIPHHGQAVRMADVALEVSMNPATRSLAEKIKAAQDREIVTLEGWLRDWDQPVPDRDGPLGHGGMGEGGGLNGMMVDGMMSEADMARLENASGADFDRTFLEMMVRHHEGAVAMAKTETAAGEYLATTDLAQGVITAQEAEIAEMQALLSAAG